jgi:hypothetical protein
MAELMLTDFGGHFSGVKQTTSGYEHPLWLKEGRSEDSGEAERWFRREAERHSGMNPNTIRSSCLVIPLTLASSAMRTPGST